MTLPTAAFVVVVTACRHTSRTSGGLPSRVARSRCSTSCTVMFTTSPPNYWTSEPSSPSCWTSPRCERRHTGPAPLRGHGCPLPGRRRPRPAATALSHEQHVSAPPRGATAPLPRAPPRAARARSSWPRLRAIPPCWACATPLVTRPSR